MTFRFDNSYRRDLAGGILDEQPDVAPAPELVALNQPLARQLGLDVAQLHEKGAKWFSGAELPLGAEPLAQAYSGHQFGGFSPVLGDGRAHLLGEILTPEGRFDLALKGSGRTRFSRGGDGKAAIGPMLREYIMSECLHALGVPTTRSLAVALTGETVLRDGKALPGAVLTRIAASHIRVGTFQFFAARGDRANLRALTDHAISRHDPDLLGQEDAPLRFFDRVVARQTKLIAQWMSLGFVHGVMNTDNMAVSGETIDYGPCAFIDAFSPGAVFSSIDRQGRYAWGNQPLILGWNLARLAEAMLELFDPDPEVAVGLANQRLGDIAAGYRREWLGLMRQKLGLMGAEPSDGALIDDFLLAMQGADWTRSLRAISAAAEGDISHLRAEFEDFAPMQAWLPRWRERLAPGVGRALDSVNPAVIARNHRVEEALTAANLGKYAPLNTLVDAIRNPYRDAGGYMLAPPPSSLRYVTYCGT